MRRLVSWSAAWRSWRMLAWTTSPAILGHASRLGSSRREVLADHRGTGRPTSPTPSWSKGSTTNGSGTGRRPSRSIAKAVERWPSRTEFSRRLRLCELHFKLVRRYQDVSFRNVLLRLPREQAIDLYAEVLERIQTHYVDPVPLEPLVRHGLDNLEVALRDPLLRPNERRPPPLPSASPGSASNSANMRGQLAVARPDRGRSRSPSPPASSPARASSCRRRPCCSSSPAAPATPSTTSRAT